MLFTKVKLVLSFAVKLVLRLAVLRGGHWGLSETEKPAKIFTKTEKPEEKPLKTEKNAENNDQCCKFVIFNPSAVDTTAKIFALVTHGQKSVTVSGLTGGLILFPFLSFAWT